MIFSRRTEETEKDDDDDDDDSVCFLSISFSLPTGLSPFLLWFFLKLSKVEYASVILRTSERGGGGKRRPDAHTHALANDLL